MEGVNADTVWTWNAIGKRAGAWGLDTDAPEATRGFLLNHLIAELLPEQAAATAIPTAIRSPARPPGTTCRCASSGRSTRRTALTAPRFEALRPTAVAMPPADSCATAPTALGDGIGGGRAMTTLPRRRPAEEARPRHRPRHLRRLPGLRDQLQGMEHRRLLGAADRPGPLRRRSARRLAQPHPRLRGGRGRGQPDRALPALLPALRGARLRHRLPDRRLLQARRGRHRAGQPRHLHRLQAVLLGLPLRRARVRLRRRRHEEMHAVRRPHLQRGPGRRRTACRPACAPARPGRAISATSAIATARCRKLVAERGGFDLLPEFGYKPVNKYLPPRSRRDTQGDRRHAGRAERCSAPARPPTACSPGSTACCPR